MAASNPPPGLEISVNHYDLITLFLACKIPKGEEAECKQHAANVFDQLCRSFVAELTDFYPTTGHLVGVFLQNHKPNGEWVRGQVVECVQQTQGWQYKVLLVDRGQYVKVPRRYLVQLNEPMKRSPHEAKRIGLYGVLPTASLSQNARLLITDFLHRGPVYFKTKQKIKSVYFGDVMVRQESDGRVVSLTDHLLKEGLVTRVDNFQQEAVKFYRAVEGMEEPEVSDQSSSDGAEEKEAAPESSPQSVQDRQDGKTNQSKDTGYSSSDDYYSDGPFVRDDAVFVPAGFQPRDSKTKQNKGSKNKKEEIKPIKTYFEIMKERKRSGERRKRPKEERKSKIQEEVNNVNREGHFEKTQVDRPKSYVLEENMSHEDIFESRKVSFFGVKSQNSSPENKEGEKPRRAFNFNYKVSVDNVEAERESEGNKCTHSDTTNEVNAKSKQCTGEESSTPGSVQSDSGTNMLKSEVSDSIQETIDSHDDSSVSICNKSEMETVTNVGISDISSCSAGSDCSKLTKKQRVIQKLQAGIAAREIIRRYSGGDVENNGRDQDMTSVSNISDIGIQSEEKNLDETTGSVSREKNTNTSLPININDSDNTINVKKDISNLNASLDTETAKCLSLQGKKKRIQEKLRKRSENDFATDSDASQRDLSTSCSLSVCSEDSVGRSKPERPTLGSILPLPIEELEKQEDNYDYVDVYETQTFLKGIISNTGVLIHTRDDRVVRPAITLTDCCLDGNIIQALHNRGKREMNRIQKFSYPMILARRNIVMISPRRSGKTCGYVVPISCNLLSEDFYKTLPCGNGPRAVVLTPCWESGAFAASEFKLTSTANTVIHCYGGGAEAELKTELLRGCDVLVTTPRCLLRLLDYGLTNLSRLCHLVMDDADILFDKFKLEMQKVMVAVDSAEGERERRNVQVQLQVVLAARTWTLPLQELVTCILANPTICIASQLEACVYAGIRPTAVFIQSDKKIEKLVDILKEVEGKHRTVVMCRTKENVKTVYHLLIDLGVRNVIAAHEDLSNISISEVPLFWHKTDRISERVWSESSSLPVLVRSDAVLEEVPVTDATVLVHYDMPTSKKTFGLRFTCLMESFHNVLKKEPKKQKPQVVILLDEKNVVEVPGVMEFMKRLGTVLPEPVLDTVEKIEKLKDEERMTERLCEGVKQFGECWDARRCPARHLVTKELDSPDAVPSVGWVKVMVQYVHDASHFSVRLLEHAEVKGKWKRLPSDLNVLPLKLNNHFAVPANKMLHGFAKEGDVVALETSVGVYQRAVVLKVVEVDKYSKPVRALVRLMDNGRYDQALVNRMWYLPQELASPPPSVVDVYLCGLRPKDLDVSWPPAPGAWVEEQLRQLRRDSPDGYMLGKIVLALKGSLWLEPVEYLEYLPGMETTVFLLDLRKDLLRTDNATQNPGHIPALRRLCDQAGILLAPEEKPKQKKLSQPRPQWAWLPQDRCESVHIVVVQDPDAIFLRLNYFSDCLQKLIEEIQKYASTQSSSGDCKSVLDVGYICLGKPTGADEWNRAIIKSRPSEDEVELFFTDFGDTDVVPWTQVMPIPNKLITQLPFQVIECYLAGVKFVTPKQDVQEFEDKVIDTIYDLSRNEMEEALPLMVMVREVESNAKYTGGRRYKVDLVNGNVEPPTIINSHLISSGLAELEDGEELLENFKVPENTTDENYVSEEEIELSTGMEIVPAAQGLDLAVLDDKELARLENERKVAQFLKDLEEKDFDCSIFHGIGHEAEDDADESDSVSEGSVLSLPRPAESLPHSRARHLALPPPPSETEDSLTGSSLNSSTLSLNLERKRELSEDKPCDANAETVRDRVPVVPVANSTPKCDLDPTPSPTSSEARGVSPGSKNITGVAKNFRDLISPNLLAQQSLRSTSPTHGVISPDSKLNNTPLAENEFDDLDECELDNTMCELNAGKTSPPDLNATLTSGNVDNKDVELKGTMQIEENVTTRSDDCRKEETCVLECVDKKSPCQKSDDCRKEETCVLESVDKKSPCQKWVECVIQDSDEDLSLITQNSMVIEENHENENLEVRTPLVEWHQDDNFVYLHVKLPALTEYELKTNVTSVHFSAIYGGLAYKVDLPELFGGHKRDKARGVAQACFFEIRLEKLLKGKRKHWPRLTKKEEKFHWLKLNAEKACEGLADSDDEDVKRLACSLPLWNENSTDSNSVASSENEIANSELSL